MNLRLLTLSCAALSICWAGCASNSSDEHIVSVEVVPSAHIKAAAEKSLGDALVAVASIANVSAGIPDPLRDAFFNAVQTTAGAMVIADATGGAKIRDLNPSHFVIAFNNHSLWIAAASEARNGKLQFHNGPVIDVALARPNIVKALTAAAQHASNNRQYAVARSLAQSARANTLVAQIDSAEANDLLAQGEVAFRLTDYDAARAMAKRADSIQTGLDRSQALASRIFEEVGGEVRSFVGHTGAVTSVAFSPDGTEVLSAGRDHTLKLWDAATGREVRTFAGHRDSVTGVAFSPDGKLAASGSDDSTLRLWDVASGQELGSGNGLGWHVSSVAFSPDGKLLATAGDDNQIRLWDATTVRQVRSFTGHGWKVTSVAFSPDGVFSLSGSEDDSAKLWDVATGRDVRTLQNGLSAVTSVAFSPDGRFALTGGKDRNVKLWNLGTGREESALRRHREPVRSVAFSPNGRFAVSGSDDGTIKLWDVSAGKEWCTFTGHHGAVASVVVSADGHFALSGGADGSVRLWQLPRVAWPVIQEAKK